MQFKNNQVMRFIDKLNFVHLIGIFIGLTTFFAIGYWVLSNEPALNNGLVLPSDDGNQVSFIDALYFSIVTETTLGCGDIRPTGYSRVLACSQVLLGLVLAGVIVAKITSMQGRSLRIIAYNSCGDWIEYLRVKDGRIMITLSVISLQGNVLRYDGDNYWENGEPAGFFNSELMGMTGSSLRFLYSNRDSETEHFVEGICTVQFRGPSGRVAWTRLTGTAHDFGTKETSTWQGVRAHKDESEIIHSTSQIERIELIKKYAMEMPSKKSLRVKPS